MKKFITRTNKISFFLVESEEDIEALELKDRFIDPTDNIRNILVFNRYREVAILQLEYIPEKQDSKRGYFYKICISDLYVLKELRFEGFGSNILNSLTKHPSIREYLVKNFPVKTEFEKMFFIEPLKNSDISLEEILFFLGQTTFKHKVVVKEVDNRNVVIGNSEQTIFSDKQVETYKRIN